MRKVTKAVFPVAGLGTRFLPATKANPKEMLPIVDKPLIQYAVEEAINAGIKELIFITRRTKSPIKNHFDKAYDLESDLKKKGKLKELQSVKDIIPEADNWPSFVKNRSDQFEARLVQVEINTSNSVLLNSMDGWQVPIASAHGEGRASFANKGQIASLGASHQIAMKYVDSHGQATEQYPLNPNGSIDGLTGITAAEGRVTIMMPHPERVFRAAQFSWKPDTWKDFSPWMQMFINAKLFSEGS